MMKRLALFVGMLFAVALAIVGWLGLREDHTDAVAGAPIDVSTELVARGEYLARAGNCIGCHTARGGAPFAGGRTIQTPFGAIHSTNITPDKATGIGDWNADDFWRALHNGKAKDGKLLYPAFPFPNYSKVTRADADAMYAYFTTITPVWQENREPELRFPFNYRVLLIGWRALYFRPAVHETQPSQGAEWNRGAYLVQGLGHCNACHAPRNAFGATAAGGELRGGLIPMLDWYAASLTGETGAGLGNWEVQHLTDLLKTGVSARGAASGPMAEVVRDSLQHLTDRDIRAMAVYLKSLPQSAPENGGTAPRATPANEEILKLGATLYEKHCVDCHKADGSGEAPHFPPLAGNRGLMLNTPVNPIRAVLHGGYPPSTAGNPYPFGMPPFGNVLDDAEVAAVLSYVRNAWGNKGAMVSARQVNRHRSVSLD
jgi:mono/diheme cytochrome c family protein